MPRHDPIHSSGTAKALRDAIRRQMGPCHVVIVMAGVYASYSDWIDEEIELALYGLGEAKSVIAVRPWGNERISSRVREAADRIVGWNTESVVDAIRELA